MTHCIWYVPNATGTGAWNANKDLGSLNSEGSDIGYALPTTFNSGSIASAPLNRPSPNYERRSTHVIEFGVLGRHHVSLDLISAVYWDSGFRSGNMGNTGNSADESRGGGGYIDGTNVKADLATDNAEIFYVSPNADNLYYGQTVWRSSFRVYKRSPISLIPGYAYIQAGVPLTATAQPNPADATMLVFESGDKAYDHITTNTYPGTDFNSPVGM